MDFNVYYNKMFTYSLADVDNNIAIHRTDIRSFTGFDSYDDLIQWYMSVKPEHRFFDEVISGARKFMLDLDCKDNIDIDEWKDIISCYKSQIKSYMDRPIIMNYTSNGINVLSSHLIITNYYTQDAISSYSIATDILYSVPIEYRKYLDMSIYKDIQFMRIEGSYKVNTNRCIYLNKHNNIYDLKLSLLGYIDNCIPLYPSSIYKRNKHNNISDAF